MTKVIQNLFLSVDQVNEKNHTVSKLVQLDINIRGILHLYLEECGRREKKS